jgi:putative tryptophan/tyrosine transport system substrate-binding protein
MKHIVGFIAIYVILAANVQMAQAQPAKKIPRIGYLAAVSPAADAPRKDAFRQTLRDLGYIEGQNILIEYRHEDRNFERLPELAAELVQLKSDVFVTVTTNAALAARNANKSIPHVFMGVTDPVTAGLVDSLARPGGNSTGITNMAAILAGKRLELLKEIVPKLSRVAVLWDPQAPGSAPQWQDSQVPARELGLQLHSMEISSADRYEEAFKDAVKAHSGAVAVTLNPWPIQTKKRSRVWQCTTVWRRCAREQITRTTAISWLMDRATVRKVSTELATSARFLKVPNPLIFPWSSRRSSS